MRVLGPVERTRRSNATSTSWDRSATCQPHGRKIERRQVIRQVRPYKALVLGPCLCTYSVLLSGLAADSPALPGPLTRTRALVAEDEIVRRAITCSPCNAHYIVPQVPTYTLAGPGPLLHLPEPWRRRTLETRADGDEDHVPRREVAHSNVNHCAAFSTWLDLAVGPPSSPARLTMSPSCRLAIVYSFMPRSPAYRVGIIAHDCQWQQAQNHFQPVLHCGRISWPLGIVSLS